MLAGSGDCVVSTQVTMLRHHAGSEHLYKECVMGSETKIVKRESSQGVSGHRVKPRKSADFNTVIHMLSA